MKKENALPYLSIFHHRHGESYQIIEDGEDGADFWERIDDHDRKSDDEWIDSWLLPPLYECAPELLQAVKDLLEELYDSTDPMGQRLYKEYGRLIRRAEGRTK